MKDLLDSEESDYADKDNGKDSLKINQEYKRKYDERKRREALSRAKELLNNNNESDDLSDYTSSSSEDEDSDAELLDFATQSKILDTLTLIKERNPSIYDKSHIIFPESEDESGDENGGESKKVKPMTYKDYEREILLSSQKGDNKLSGDESETELEGSRGSKLKKIGYDKEQEELKRAFIEASNKYENDSEEGDSETFVRKEKTVEELEEEERTFKAFLSSNLNNVNGDPMESLNRYWGPEEDLNDNERFLRNYILNQEWKEAKGNSRINDAEANSCSVTLDLDEINEEEDEKHLELSNEFESIYNFRYEEPNIGQQIQSYSRNIPSVRRQDDRRKLKRKEKKERRAEERVRLREEVKMLKSLKKKEIMKKIGEIQKISGNNKITSKSIDLEGEFDSEKHDKCMESIFGEDYNNEDENLTLSEILSEKQDRGDSPCNEILGNNACSCGENEEEWWQCDVCLKEILPNKKKFDCTVCENYTLCKSCCRNSEHEHPLTKSRVPEGESTGNNTFNFKYGDNEDINKLLDEYYGLDFEDILDNGKLQVRFKYTKVDKEDYGLKIEDILSMNDKELNQHVSLKKLAPYRTDQKARYIHSKKRNLNTDKSVSKTINKRNKRGHEKKVSIDQINKHRLEAYY
ncbi:hypothetical protein FG386_000515 [Cryptosporidium ryanae]|uniref:uncharacterized protein n=1 Tax=Cryptosporidium ryanae TaxID=515981 RepID=UPI003519FA8F|nr:hypothetical protein FG386_000515 [Cryptosporidium ryanae]